MKNIFKPFSQSGPPGGPSCDTVAYYTCSNYPCPGGYEKVAVYEVAGIKCATKNVGCSC